MNTWQAGAAAAMGVWATMGGVLAPYRAVLHTAEHHQAVVANGSEHGRGHGGGTRIEEGGIGLHGWGQR